MNRRDFLGKMVRTAVGVGAMGAVGVSRIASLPAGQVTVERGWRVVKAGNLPRNLFNGRWQNSAPASLNNGLTYIYRTVITRDFRRITEFMWIHE